ncbi:MAG: hypothetical protein ABIR80_18820 [Opitutaceae bacterium]
MSGHTSNRDDYRKSFLRHVHCLIQLGYSSLIPTAFSTSEEDDITGELCRHMQILTEETLPEPWMHLYSVHDQSPVHGAIDTHNGPVKRGKRRPKLDIRFVSKCALPNPHFCVEAKRLYRSGSVSSYVNDEGLGAFVAGYYAKEDDAGGMLGYVQTESVIHWQAKLEARLDSEASALTIAAGRKFAAHRFEAGPAHTFMSRHSRTAAAQPIDIFHTLLAFC